jgi:hypothetical protein
MQMRKIRTRGRLRVLLEIALRGATPKKDARTTGSFIRRSELDPSAHIGPTLGS